MAIIDVTTFNGEQELFEIRYGVLKEYVDEFIVIEFDKTFSGKPKEPQFPKETYPDVTYHFFTEETYGKYKELAESSPNTIGADHWKLEFMQKESIKDALTHLKDDDTVFIGDVDEVWDPDYVGVLAALASKLPRKLKLTVYTYWLNNRSSEEFWGTLVAKYGGIQNECLNHLRTNLNRLGVYGWHFTSMGGTDSLKKKLTDSYTHESYASPSVLENLEYNMASNKDFLGRDFTYTLDEKDWPRFLKETREKYKHLIKQA